MTSYQVISLPIRCPRCVRTCDHAYCFHLWCELNMQTCVLLPVINRPLPVASHARYVLEKSPLD